MTCYELSGENCVKKSLGKFLLLLREGGEEEVVESVFSGIPVPMLSVHERCQ